MIRWTFSILGAMFLGLTPKPRCAVCGERCRDLDAHVWLDHAEVS